MNKIEKLLSLGLILLCVAGTVRCMDDDFTDGDDDTEFFEIEDDDVDIDQLTKPADLGPNPAGNTGGLGDKPGVGGPKPEGTGPNPAGEAKEVAPTTGVVLSGAEKAEVDELTKTDKKESGDAGQKPVGNPGGPGDEPEETGKKSAGEGKELTLTTGMILQGAGATAIVVTIGGIWYCVTHSVLKQAADLNRLDSQCAQVFGTVARGNTQFECLAIESVICIGLEPQLQDKLDDAIALYAMAVKDLCCAMKANGKGKVAQLPQYGVVQAKLLACKQVIAECKAALNKKPILADRILISSSRAATSIGRRLMGTTTSLINKVKSLTARKVKKAV